MLQKQKYFGKEHGEHKQDAEWIDIAGENLTFEKQNAVRMAEDEVTRKVGGGSYKYLGLLELDRKCVKKLKGR